MAIFTDVQDLPRGPPISHCGANMYQNIDFDHFGVNEMVSEKKRASLEPLLLDGHFYGYFGSSRKIIALFTMDLICR